MALCINELCARSIHGAMRLCNAIPRTTAGTTDCDAIFRFAVNMTLQLNREVVRVLEIAGQGCNKSHIVHVGCWNVLTVARAQHVISNHPTYSHLAPVGIQDSNCALPF